jgi:hypothetical protein
MDTIENIAWSLYPFIPIAIFVGVAVAGIELYRLWRDRLVMKWKIKDAPSPNGGNGDNAAGDPPTAISGLNADGELTTAAKYAIWNYMFGMLAIGGTVIGVRSGIAGYMIKDLATKNAMQTAFIQMQKPLTDHMNKFTTADAALQAAYKTATDKSEFPNEVAKTLVAKHQNELRGPRGENGKDGKDAIAPPVSAIAMELVEKHSEEIRGKPGRDGVAPSVSDVAQELFAKHGDQLRGKPGLDGKSGVDGKDAVAPSISSIAIELAQKHSEELRGKDGRDGKNGVAPSVSDVAQELISKYGDQLRGKPGLDGKNGVDGKAGADAVAPSAAAVADELFKKYGAQLRGKDGMPGKDAVSPTVAAVVAELMAAHRQELRGKDGRDGKDGAPGRSAPGVAEIIAVLLASHAQELRGERGYDGKNGASGKDGVSPDPNKIAELVVNQYGDRLRGKSPTTTEIAAAIWDSHGDELRRGPTVKQRRHSGGGTSRRRG